MKMAWTLWVEPWNDHYGLTAASFLDFKSLQQLIIKINLNILSEQNEDVQEVENYDHTKYRPLRSFIK